jgi:hypothetical protein
MFKGLSLLAMDGFELSVLAWSRSASVSQGQSGSASFERPETSKQPLWVNIDTLRRFLLKFNALSSIQARENTKMGSLLLKVYC